MPQFCGLEQVKPILFVIEHETISSRGSPLFKHNGNQLFSNVNKNDSVPCKADIDRTCVVKACKHTVFLIIKVTRLFLTTYIRFQFSYKEILKSFRTLKYQARGLRSSQLLWFAHAVSCDRQEYQGNHKSFKFYHRNHHSLNVQW